MTLGRSRSATAGLRSPKGPESAPSELWRFGAGLVSLVALVIVFGLGTIALVPRLLPGWTSVTISSGSMEPALQVGDVVAVRTASDGYGQGAIISFDQGSGIITHRIVERTDAGLYVTKGDANPTADSSLVDPSTVLGAGRMVVPFAGLPAVWAAEGNLLALTVALVSVAAMLALARFAIDPAFDPWQTAATDEETLVAGDEDDDLDAVIDLDEIGAGDTIVDLRPVDEAETVIVDGTTADDQP